MRDSLFVYNKTASSIPRLPYRPLKNHILGEKYNVSIVFVGEKKSRELNRQYRKKDHPANILSFPLSKTEGEIFMHPHSAKKDAQKFGMTYRRFLILLLIHGMLHLKGMRHGSKMKLIEQTLGQKFSR